MSMWAIARVDLGITDREFWRLSFRRFAALADRAHIRRQAADRRAGIVASLLATQITRRTWRPEEFFESLVPEPEVQDWETQLRIVEALNEAFGGKDLRAEKGA